MVRMLIGGCFCVLTVFAQQGTSPYWTQETLVPNLGGSSSGGVGTNMGVTSDGTIYSFFFILLGLNFDLYLSKSEDEGATWSEPVFFEPATDGAVGPVVVVDRNDRIHVAWLQRIPTDTVRYAYSDDGAETWSKPQVVSAAVRHQFNSPIITVDRQNRVHIMWHDGHPEEEGMPAEAWYNRSPDNGTTFDGPTMLSLDDNLNSAFPRADFTGTDGDDLIIVWRDNRPQVHWDTYGVISDDGGATWTEVLVAGGNGDQWDPMSLVTRDGDFHVSWMQAQFGDPFVVDIWWIKSMDAGQNWTEGQILSEGERSRFSFYVYNRPKDLIWLFWKDERDFNTDNGNPEADLAGKYSEDGGDSWSSLRFVTDKGDFDVRFPAFVIDQEGTVHCTYSYSENDNQDPFAIYYTRREDCEDLDVADPTGITMADLTTLAGMWSDRESDLFMLVRTASCL